MTVPLSPPPLRSLLVGNHGQVVAPWDRWLEQFWQTVASLEGLTTSSHAILTIGASANGLSLGGVSGQELELAAASPLSGGAMSAADFSKLAAISGTNTGDAPLAVLGEGISKTAAASSIDFVGGGVAVTNIGGAVTVTIPQGATSVGAPSGSSTANAGSISAGVLTLHPADATNPGLLTAGTQTIAGAKTWNGAAAFGSTLAVAGVFTVDGNLIETNPTTNRVGLNKTPGVTLDVLGSTTSGNCIRIQHSDASGSAQLRFLNSSASELGGIGIGNPGVAAPYAGNIFVAPGVGVDFLVRGSAESLRVTYAGVVTIASVPVVTTTDTQTLSAKTLTSPTINSGAMSGTFTGSPTFSSGLTAATLTSTTLLIATRNTTGVHCAAIQNTHTGGYGSWLFVDSAGSSKMHFGFGNSATAAPFTSSAFLELFSGVTFKFITGSTLLASLTTAGVFDALTLRQNGVAATTEQTAGPTVLGFHANAINIAAGTYYLRPWHYPATANTNELGMPMSFSGAVRTAYMNGMTGGAGGTINFTLRKNGVDTALTWSVGPGATTANATSTVTFVAGDLLSVKIVHTGVASAISEPTVSLMVTRS